MKKNSRFFFSPGRRKTPPPPRVVDVPNFIFDILMDYIVLFIEFCEWISSVDFMNLQFYKSLWVKIQSFKTAIRIVN